MADLYLTECSYFKIESDDNVWRKCKVREIRENTILVETLKGRLHNVSFEYFSYTKEGIFETDNYPIFLTAELDEDEE